MDEIGHENARHRIELYKEAHTQLNMMPQYNPKDQNALSMNRMIMRIASERDAAVEERDRALSERKTAIDERDAVIEQRDAAISERNNAIKERDNAIAALRFQEHNMNSLLNHGIQRGSKRMHHATNHPSKPSQAAFKAREGHIPEAFPIQAFPPDTAKVHPAKRTKQNKLIASKPAKSSRKVKKISEDLNMNVTADGSKAEFDAQDIDLGNQISFDASTMPSPVCSCTGIPRQCYKWGNGGWQSSCCTTTLSEYPLPQMPNKRHSRMGGRKMSGSVFNRLLNRVASQGHDLHIPVDLKEFWARHGTNRYITIK